VGEGKGSLQKPVERTLPSMFHPGEMAQGEKDKFTNSSQRTGD
jgi:hypothetical protein